VTDEPCKENKTMFQAFEWYVPADQKHWQRISKIIPILKAIGINTIWLPPGCKASRPEGNGYDIYDLYDLGEFEQKGHRATKWGSKADLIELVRTAQVHDVGLYWDAVLNHRASADAAERCHAVRVDPKGMEMRIIPGNAHSPKIGGERSVSPKK